MDETDARLCTTYVYTSISDIMGESSIFIFLGRLKISFIPPPPHLFKTKPETVCIKF